MNSDLLPDTMADLQEILTTVRDIYQSVSQVHGLIKDHEQDLVIVEKADSLLEDTKTNLQYLNDCIQKYGSEVRRTDQTTDSMYSRVSGSSHAPPHGTGSGTTTQPFAKLGEDEMKRQIENTMRHMMMEMFELLERKNSSCSADSGVGSAQSTKHSPSVDGSADFDIL